MWKAQFQRDTGKPWILEGCLVLYCLNFGEPLHILSKSDVIQAVLPTILPSLGDKESSVYMVSFWSEWWYFMGWEWDWYILMWPISLELQKVGAMGDLALDKSYLENVEGLHHSQQQPAHTVGTKGETKIPSRLRRALSLGLCEMSKICKGHCATLISLSGGVGEIWF